MAAELIVGLGLLVGGIVMAFQRGGVSWGFVVIFAIFFITIFLLYAFLHEFEEVKEKLRWAGLALIITAAIPLLAVIACH